MMEYEYNGKLLILSEHCTLRSAFQWVAAKRPPVIDRDKPFVEEASVDDKNQKSAKLELFYQLMRGGINATGVACKMQREAGPARYPLPNSLIFYATIIDARYVGPINIPPTEWQFENIAWNDSALVDKQFDSLFESEYNGYTDVRVPTAKLMELFPDKESNPSEATRDPIYSTPFMNVMREAVEHFGITESEQVGTKILIPWFENRLQELGETAPKNKAKMMSTFVRNPELQKGGNTKSRK